MRSAAAAAAAALTTRAQAGPSTLALVPAPQPAQPVAAGLSPAVKQIFHQRAYLTPWPSNQQLASAPHAAQPNIANRHISLLLLLLDTPAQAVS